MQRICHGYRFASSKDIFRSKRFSTKQRKSFYFIMAKANLSKGKQIDETGFLFFALAQICAWPDANWRSSMWKKIFNAEKSSMRKKTPSTGTLAIHRLSAEFSSFLSLLFYGWLTVWVINTVLLEIEKKLDKILNNISLILFLLNYSSNSSWSKDGSINRFYNSWLLLIYIRVYIYIETTKLFLPIIFVP